MLSLLNVYGISRLTLLPLGADWVPILPDRLESFCPSSEKPLCRLRDNQSNILPLLLCSLLSGDQGHVLLPSSEHCAEILNICAVFDRAKKTCPQINAFLCIPPTVLGRIARSTSCVLEALSCITLAIFCAISCPVCICLPGGNVGDFCFSDVSCSCRSNRRVVGFSSSLTTPNFQTLCEINSKASIGRLFLCIKDCPMAATKAPLLIAELRAVLFSRKHRRYVRRWFASFDISPKPSPTPTNARPVNLLPQSALVASAFSLSSESSSWAAGACCLKAWMSGVMTPTTWTSAHESSRKAMIDSCRCSLSPVVQKVLLDAKTTALTTPGVYVYVLFSPLWGKCYVGAVGFGKNRRRCPLERWIEHTKQALLWNSKASRKRCASRRSCLYSAMAAIDPANVIQVIVAQPSPNDLASAERFFIRKLQPVFNIREVDDCAIHLAKSLSALTVDDVVTYGNRLLRQARPRLTANQWACIIADAASNGDRSLAAKLARHARTTCSKAKMLRALPQVIIPCAVPQHIIRHTQNLLRSALLQIPGFQRHPQFTIQLQVGRVCWSKTPTADAILAPSFPKLSPPLPCNCQRYNVNKVQGHVCARQWWDLPPCNMLRSLVGASTLAFRTFPSLDCVVDSVRRQAIRKLQSSGMPQAVAEEASETLARTLQSPFEHYWSTLPQQLFVSNLKRALRPVHKAGLMFVRVDRNPGRIIIMCPSLWVCLQRIAFLQSHRYSISDFPPSSKDPDFSKNTIASFVEFVFRKCGYRVYLRKSSSAARPRGYFTVKQKSQLLQTPAVVKFRPIISHSLHPCKAFLRRVARALSILASLAAHAVHEAKPTHLPIWRMHQGTHQWLTLLATQSNVRKLVEFDVEDCFLITPRELVLPALRFWMDFRFKRGRSARYFAISKNSKDEDHLGRPCSPHYWEVSADAVVATVEWEMEHNAFFEVLNESGETVVLKQHTGLPIGGHLSAALVELAALYRELLQPRPTSFGCNITARYRDNYFSALTNDAVFPMDDTAAQLSTLLCMPVKPVSQASCARFLETFLSFDAESVCCTLGFRTDADRQGESGDVQSWPPPFDPRVRAILPGLLMGTVSKLRFYTAPGIGGFTATVRRIYQFVKACRYPRRWWLRPLAIAFVRIGVAVPCLPRMLRLALSWQSNRCGHKNKPACRTLGTR